MDWEFLQHLLVIGAAIAAIWGRLEVRIMSLRTEFMAKLEDKNKINEVIQQNLKLDLERIEGKVDMLISLAINGGSDKHSSQE